MTDSKPERQASKRRHLSDFIDTAPVKSALLGTAWLFSPALFASAPTESLGSSLAKTSLMLLVVLAAIFALAWLVRKTQTINLVQGRNVQLLETMPLGKSEKVCLVKAGDKYLLLGVTANSIQCLDELVAESIDNRDSTPDAWQWAKKHLPKKAETPGFN